MCGIAGFTHRGRHLPEGTLAAALSSLRHRGPDQRGQFISTCISMGVTRLRVTDIEGGDQPFQSEDGDVTTVLNGEIFNHAELRQELERAGIRFATRCDTEVALKAYLCWGVSGLARFRGMFAVAVWVESEKRLLLARDPMGIKPMYYRVHGEDVFFGSELKAIFAHPDVPRRLCLDGLNCFLSLNYVPGPYTLVDGIMKLPAGHVLDWRNGNISIYPNSQNAPSHPVPKSFEDAKVQLDHLLQTSVAEHMVSDVPVGIWLSGGLDSSAILHYAAQHQPRSLRTFSITFRGRSFDEGRHAREMADHYGAEHTTLDLNPSLDLTGAIEQMAYFSDEPSADAGALASWFLAKMTKPKATVALSGEGSDELFAGYLTYRADRYAAWARRIPAPLRRMAIAAADCLPVSDEKIGFEYKLKRFLHGLLLAPGMAHIFWNGTFTEEEKRQLFYYAYPHALKRLVSEIDSQPGLAGLLRFDQRYYLMDDILCKVDRMSMAHSVEARPPFLDPRIVSFANSLPDSWKLNRKGTKHVLRSLMSEVLPQKVVRRPKIGLDIPIHDWFRGALKPFLLDTLSQQAVESAGLFRWSEVERLLGQHMNRKRNVGYHLWGLMTLQLWMNRWNIEPARSSTAETAISLLYGVGSL